MPITYLPWYMGDMRVKDMVQEPVRLIITQDQRDEVDIDEAEFLVTHAAEQRERALVKRRLSASEPAQAIAYEAMGYADCED